MKEIYEYRVFIPKNPNKKSEFTISQHKMLAENDNYLVINNSSFQTIAWPSLTRNYFYPTLNKHSITEWTGAVAGINYQEFSDHPIKPGIIKNRIMRFIVDDLRFWNDNITEDKYSWIAKADLNFIKEAK